LRVVNLPAGASPEPTDRPDHEATPEPLEPREPLDLERIERELSGVDVALRRLDDGTYWSDEITGEAIPDDVLAADPVARRAPAEG
jgi:RNA polymerase-binding transcription factor DksA